MITRQEAIAELRLNFEEPFPESIALVLSYLESPIPDAELWENREHIGKLLGPWVFKDKQWTRSDVAGNWQAISDENTWTREEFDVLALANGYRFVDGPVTVALQTPEDRLNKIEHYEKVQHGKLQVLQDRLNEVDRVNSAQAAAIDELLTKVEKLEEPHINVTVSLIENIYKRFDDLENQISFAKSAFRGHNYQALRDQLLADVGFRQTVGKPAVAVTKWAASVNHREDAWYRSVDVPHGGWIAKVHQRAKTFVEVSFGLDIFLRHDPFDSVDSAKAWCDEQLRAAGYLLEGESK